MEDFLKFRKMITPIIIQIVFWMGAVLCVIAGVGGIVVGINPQASNGPGLILGGLLTLIVGPLLLRIYCEILIVLFGIHDTLTDIKNKMRDTIG